MARGNGHCVFSSANDDSSIVTMTIGATGARAAELEELRERPVLERLEEAAPDEGDRDQSGTDPGEEAPGHLDRRFPEFPHRRHATPCHRD